MEVGMAFWPAKVLLSAIELRLFTELGATSKTGDELQAALRLHPRANPDFFDTLVALRFLDREGDGAGGTLSQHAGKLPYSSIGTVHSSWAASWKWPMPACTAFWGDLTEGLRTGNPQNEIKHTGAAHVRRALQQA